MQRVLFILTVAAIGIAPGSSIMTGQQAVDAAYEAIRQSGNSLRISHWRPANCPDEKNIHRGIYESSGSKFCTICLCGGNIKNPFSSLNCNTDIYIDYWTDMPANIRHSWEDGTTLSEWTSVRYAEPYQLYKVSDGICYVTDYNSITGKSMKCFTNRFYTPK